MKSIFTACLCAAAVASSPAIAQNWIIETVAPFGVYFDIAVEAAGTPHILFVNCQAWEICEPIDPGNPQLTYGKKVGADWDFETVANDPVGDYITIILDDTGAPHIAYKDSTWQMHYGYRGDGGWTVEDLYHERLLRYRASPSLVLDGSGEPHIAFIERERIRYAYKTGGAWTDEEVMGSSLDNWSARAAIAIDGTGELHVGSWMYYNSAVFFTRGASSWTYELLGGDIGYNPWMVLDSNDAAHFIYHGSRLSYATNSSGSWVEKPIDPEGINGADDIVLDMYDRPIVAYSTAVLVSVNPFLYDVDLNLARRLNDVWVKERIDSVQGVEYSRWSPRLDIDALGTIHLLYHHVQTGEIRYGVRDVPSTVEATPPRLAERILSVVPNPFNPGTEIIFQLDSRKFVALSVYDVTGRRVRTLLRSAMSAVNHRVPWDGKTDSGAEATSGVYFVRLETGTETYTIRAVLTK